MELNSEKYSLAENKLLILYTLSKVGKPISHNKLQELGYRVSLDDREEKVGYRMRESVMRKIPYTLVLGQKEVDDKTLILGIIL